MYFRVPVRPVRRKKTRTVFTDAQLRVLEKTFSEQRYLDSTNRAKLSHILGLKEAQVKTWFQNRRMKWKKKMAKTDEKPDSSTTTKTLDNEDIHLQETAATFDGAQVETFSSGGGSQIPFNYTVDPRTKLPTSSSKLTGMLKSISLVFFLDLSGK